MSLRGRGSTRLTFVCACLGVALAWAPGTGLAAGQPAADTAEHIPDAGDWPRTIETEAGTFTVYQFAMRSEMSHVEWKEVFGAGV